jgi:hypothetical protein
MAAAFDMGPPDRPLPSGACPIRIRCLYRMADRDHKKKTVCARRHRGLRAVALVGAPRNRPGRSIETRPGFAAMLAYIASNGARTIIVETPSRFARDLMVQEVTPLVRDGLTSSSLTAT